MIRQNIAFATKDFFDIQKATYMELNGMSKTMSECMLELLSSA